MQIQDHAKYLGLAIRPGAAGHRWTEASTTCVGVCARASAPRRVWSKDVSLSRYMPRLYAATIAAENLALQRLSAGPFHSIPSALLRQGSACGLKIDADGIQLTSKAARFRVTSQSAVLSTGMDRIRAAEDYCGGTLDSFTRSWDDKYFHTSTAHFTASTLR